jgi:hypothetical protein
MQPLQTDAAAHADEAEADLGAAVLLNGLLFSQIWSNLDADDKKQLRAVARGVMALADGLVVSVTMHGKSADLASALDLWPDVERLAADCDDDSAAVISAAPLPKLRELVLKHAVRFVPCGRHAHARCKEGAASRLSSLARVTCMHVPLHDWCREVARR